MSKFRHDGALYKEVFLEKTKAHLSVSVDMHRSNSKWRVIRMNEGKPQVKLSVFAVFTCHKVKISPQLQNTLSLICISLNKNSIYCYVPRSSKHIDTCNGWAGVFCNRSKYLYPKKGSTSQVTIFIERIFNRGAYFLGLDCRISDHSFTSH